MPIPLSRLGIVNGTSNGSFDQDNANFLVTFSGEVVTAFDEVNRFLDKHMVRTIQSGKSAQFPATWKVDAQYHVAGNNIADNAQSMKHNARLINIDNLLYSNLTIYELDELKNHYDIRSEYAKQMAAALSRKFDQKIGRMIVKAARSAANVSGGDGGTVLNMGATVETDALVLARAIFNAAQVFDEKNVADTERYVGVKPAQYYLLAQAKDIINSQWGGSGSYSEGTVNKIAGMELVKNNNMPTGVITAVAGEQNDYTGTFTNTVATAWHKTAVATVKLKDLTTEMTGQDFKVMYQGTMLNAKYAMGHGILRPEAAVEITKA